jgi:hypothetical protein
MEPFWLQVREFEGDCSYAILNWQVLRGSSEARRARAGSFGSNRFAFHVQLIVGRMHM